MAKRATSVFETAPIIQGDWDGTGTGDVINTQNASEIHDAFDDIFDNYQGSVVCWITPEWNGNDGLYHEIITDRSTGTFRLRKLDTNFLQLTAGNRSATVDISGWTAGTTYFVVGRWDTKNTLDGTNFFCISINDSHTFSQSGAVSLLNFGAYGIGNSGIGSRNADAIIEGLTVYRRLLFDGTYGVAANWDDSGPIDEINAIYNAGSGQDPCLVTGSWDVVFCLPTDSTAGALVTGTGEAWSHPHSSGVLEHQWLEDGGYLGRPWAVLFNGSSTVIDCGSGATLDDVAAGGNQFTIEAWIRYDASTADWRVIVAKGTTDLGWQFGATNADQLRLLVGLDTTDAQAVTSVSRDGKWHHVVGHYNDATKTARVASDGVWGSANVGAGAYSTDAAQNFRIGRHSAFSSQFFNGAIGWV
ncbi:MAG: LamG domain-containing protein, partial [Candidatus Thorarchaeota archaeon]